MLNSSAFAIHSYAKAKGCRVSGNIKEVMGDVLTGTQIALENDLKRTTLADVVSKIRIAVVKEKHGHIDILFANAGGATIAPLATSAEAQFDQTFDINVK